MQIEIVIPGEPVAQGRPVFTTHGGHAHAFDPAKSRNWKAYASSCYRETATRDFGLDQGETVFAGVAVEVQIVALFACPRSHWRSVPLPRRPKRGRPDIENLAKAVMDAANGVLWIDDSQVVRLSVEKLYAAQGEAPRMVVRVREHPVPGPDATTAWLPMEWPA